MRTFHASRDDGAVVSVRIGEDQGRTALLVEGVVQSISPHDGDAVGGYWAAMVPPHARPRSALILGLGGGTLAHLLHARWGRVPTVGVDDDPSVIATARALGWLDTQDLEIETADAFTFVETCQRSFDYIAVDLFRGERIARRAFGPPFLRRLRELLVPRGSLAMNLFDDARAPTRIDRIAMLFEVVQRIVVGGNVVVHARRRR